MALRVGDVVARIKADTTNFNRGMRDVRTSTNRFQDGLRATRTLAVGAFASVATAMGAVAIASVKQADTYEQSSIAFSTMLGDAEQATEMLAELANMAKKTPFTLVGIEKAGKQLLAMGIESDKLIPTLKAIGDVSSGLSVDLNRVAYNFGQVKAQGQLTGIELRDFARAGVPMIAELAKNLNKAEGEIKTMVSAGEIGFDDVEQAFITMTSEGGKFEDMMFKQSATFSGQVSNMKDSVSLILRDIGGLLLPTLKQFNDRLIAFASTARDAIAVFKEEGLEGGLKALGADDQTINIITKIADALKVFGAWVVEHKDTILTFLKGLAVAFGALAVIGGIIALVTALTNPLVLIATAIGLLYTAWSENWGGIRDITDKIIEHLTFLFHEYKDEFIYIFNAIKAFAQSWIAFFQHMWDIWGNTIIALFTNVLKVLGSIIQNGFNIIIGIVKLVIAIFTGDWETAWNEIKRIFRAGKDIIGTILKAIVDIIKNIGISILKALVKPFDDAWNKIKEKVEKIKEKMREISPFHRDSPSLVENVTTGLEQIREAYNSLNSGLAIPNMATAGLGFGNAGASAGAVIQNVTVYPSDELDMDTIVERLAYKYKTAI